MLTVDGKNSLPNDGKIILPRTEELNDYIRSLPADVQQGLQATLVEMEGGSESGWYSLNNDIRYDVDASGVPTIEYQVTSKEVPDRETMPCYKTVGFNFADATYDPATGKLTETGLGEINLALDGTYFTIESSRREDGLIQSTWRLDWGKFMEKISVEYPAWAAKLQDQMAAQCLDINPIITVFPNGQQNGEARPTGQLLEDGTYVGQLFDKNNIEALINFLPWSAYTKQCFREKFHKAIIKNRGQMTKAELLALVKSLMEDNGQTPAGDAQTGIYQIGKDKGRATKGVFPEGATKYTTYNYSSNGQFNLGDAIPTSEDVTNGYHADKWSGNAQVGFMKGATNPYVFDGTITYKYSQPYIANYTTGEIGYHDIIKQRSYSYATERVVDYWYIDWAQFWDLQNVKDSNTVFPGGAHYFTSTHIPGSTYSYKATQNGREMGPTPESPDDDYHVEWDTAWTPRWRNDSRRTWVAAGGADMTEGEAIAAFEAEAEGRLLSADEIYVKNDDLMIDGHIYMKGDRHQYKDSKNDTTPGKEWSVYDIAEADYDYMNETQEQQGRIPPETKNKKYYTTIEVTYKGFIGSAKASPVTRTGTRGGGGDANSYIYPSSKYGFSFIGNEPIRVHTPVISPVELEYRDTAGVWHKAEPAALPPYYQTQLVNEAYNASADYQLLLDGEYAIKFIKTLHTEHVGYPAAEATPILYNKYTKRKYVAFPFTVQIDGKIYEPTPDENEDMAYLSGNAPKKLKDYTPWIQLYSDDGDGKNEDTVQFYIPPWAIEGSDYTIQYMVVPENADKADFDAYRQQFELNRSAPSDGSDHLYNYMATYTVEAQLSGLIYDFQVVGINDKDRFSGLKVTASGDTVSNGYGNTAQDYAFAPAMEEKKVGDKNRSGGSAVRYSFDGTVTTSWDAANTLPLSSGSSHAYADEGELVKGNEIAFTVRTIANLWDEDTEVNDLNDYLYIKPTFQYVDRAGGSVTDVDVYYGNEIVGPDGELMWNEFTKAGSPQDLSVYNKTRIADDKFRGSFYARDASLIYKNNRERPSLIYMVRNLLQADDLLFSKDKANEMLYEIRRPLIPTWPQFAYKSAQDYANKPAECSTMSNIKLTSELRLLTGNIEQLARKMWFYRTVISTVCSTVSPISPRIVSVTLPASKPARRIAMALPR